MSSNLRSSEGRFLPENSQLFPNYLGIQGRRPVRVDCFRHHSVSDFMAFCLRVRYLRYFRRLAFIKTEKSRWRLGISVSGGVFGRQSPAEKILLHTKMLDCSPETGSILAGSARGNCENSETECFALLSPAGRQIDQTRDAEASRQCSV
jgi:hypothetical protein